MKKLSQKGFTIIEVMIVLAIAGVMILAVLLAVPALQRNNRNTARQNDISRIGTAVNSWVSRNNGLPFVDGSRPQTIDDVDASKLSQYRGLVAATNGGASGFPVFLPVLPGAQLAIPTGQPDAIRVVTAAQCGSDGQTNPATSRAMAIQYSLETATSTIPACQNL